ncbi:short-chain dehydrogenase/reductase SDR [Thioalkalivibrio sp. K90mix]|uniref:SDR family oxidoreductase n=1 Tax=unclassified Thioalkalivibrio TaxID=2621013 RepID=UPI000195A79D|nr:MULTISPECIES: SDR family oxidoreductase [unclassified Thioalkalivibrio]ADC71525.1 short-chain dehydrogenase/reductase SDR [Thioalkalivibrio sp. K90mix]
MNRLQSVVILGATSAIATAVARELAEHGARLFLVARDGERLEPLLQDLRVRGDDASGTRILGTTADLADIDAHADVWAQAREALSDNIDAVLLAWGTLPDQEACNTSVATTLEAIHVNGTSAIAFLACIAPDFEQRGRGVIAAIGSVAGDRGRQSNYVYGTAKGMLATYLQGLRNRLFFSGVDVVTIKPGFVRTPMTEGFNRAGALWAEPDTVARGIVKAMRRGRDVAYLPWIWWGIMTVIRLIPEYLFKRLKL